MADKIYDFVMLLHKALLEIDKNHPADRNALRFGALSGMGLGQAWLEVGMEKNDDILDILASGPKVALFNILEKADAMMPKGHAFNPDLFEHSDYRWSNSGIFYIAGIRLGFSYVMDLNEAFTEPDARAMSIVRKTVEYLPLVRRGISTIS